MIITMKINWRKTKEDEPQDMQECLTKMKNGLIQGFYQAENGTFGGYFYGEMEWDATEWVPIEECI